VIGIPSGSLPVKVMATAVARSVVTDCASATGGSFTGVTVMETVALVDVKPPSLTVNWKLSEPLKFKFGV
jgi:hypothetical protein